MSQVNLLPPEIRQKGKARNQAILVGIAGAAVIGLLVVFYLLQAVALSGAESDLHAQEATNAALKGQVADLLPYKDLQDQLTAQQTILDEALAYEVAWSGVLRDLQLSLPDQISIGTFSATVGASAAAPPSIPLGGGPGIVGSVNISGESQGSLRLARLLSRVSEVDGWGNPWMPSITQGDGDRWTFTTTIDLFESTVTARGSAFAAAAPVKAPATGATP